MTNYCSIIMTSFRGAKNDRAAIAARSIHSLLTVPAGFPFELCLVDNTQNNRNLGRGRNLGFSMATGDYVAIVDDDILFKQFWLVACINILCFFKGREKVISTPIHVGRSRPWWQLFYRGTVEGYDWHTRSGSNCMVMDRKSFIDIGLFREDLLLPRLKHKMSPGMEWHNRLNRKGYKILLTQEPFARDAAFKRHCY